jgi:hypothetical protein
MKGAERDLDALPVVVVPDGLAADWKTGTVFPRPSFVFRAVLDYVAAQFPSHSIYLAPANDFGCGVTEQAAGVSYLEPRRVSCIAPSPFSDNYIDTRGNARYLRQYLERNALWPLPPIILVAAWHHARRAALCFKKEGFSIARLIAVPYNVPMGEGIVPRLWYYRYPRAHRIYEFLAILRDICRPAATSNELPS